MFLMVLSIVSPTDFPNLLQSKLVTKVEAVPTAVFMPSAIVFPTSLQSVPSMKPLRNVATDFAILLQVFLMSSHWIFARAALSFCPAIFPISVKSAFAHASLIIWAKFAYLFVTSFSSKLPPSLPDDPPELLLLSSSSLLISSNPIRDFLTLSAALAAESPVLSRLAA